MKLMVVESPNKIKKIQSELDQTWKIVASGGHVRDLACRTAPHRSGLPSLSDIGIDENDFSLQYEFIQPRNADAHHRKFPGGEERVAAIKAALWEVNVVYLATDPDREGEAIAWHLLDVLDLEGKDYARITFNELSKKAIQGSLAAPRKVDMRVVHAQEARRALDRMVGYLVSPALSDVLGIQVSAGRVQSVALRMVVERERFLRSLPKGSQYGAEISFGCGNLKADWIANAVGPKKSLSTSDRALAEMASQCRIFTVTALESKTTRKAPAKPFSTVLMLTTASDSLGLPPELTARLAQRLFEQGAISYPRTDSVNFGSEATGDIRAFAISINCPVCQEPRHFETPSGSQEAHEAIRPTHIAAEVAGATDEERALYRLIRLRALASQLPDAVYCESRIGLVSSTGGRDFSFEAHERIEIQSGWCALFKATDKGLQSHIFAASRGDVPRLEVGTKLAAQSGSVTNRLIGAHKRFTKASLVGKMADEGIGRPSTYPAILASILHHRYVNEEDSVLEPTPLGELVVDALVGAKFSFVDLNFTRQLEKQLDEIADEKLDSAEILSRAYNQLLSELDNLARLRHGDENGRFRAIEINVSRCDKCGAELRRYERKSGDGFFWACTSAQCKKFFDDDHGKPVTVGSTPCPRCGRPMYRRRKKGDETGYWWGCSGFREGCDYTMDDRDGNPVPSQIRHTAISRRGLNTRRSTGVRGLHVRRRGKRAK